MSDKSAATKGLEGIVAARTRLSDVRGTEGKLIYCGYDINELAGNATYEEVVFLLYYNHLPNKEELAEVTETLKECRNLPKGIEDVIKHLPKTAPPMHALRTLVSLLGCYDTTAEDLTIDYLKTRTQFGQPMGKFQSVANRIVDMKLRLETSRLLLYRTAWQKSQGKAAMLDAALLKLHVAESFLSSSLDAIRNRGGNGYLSDFEIERDLRDAVGGVIYAGTSDIQKNIIARLLGL